MVGDVPLYVLEVVLRTNIKQIVNLDQKWATEISRGIFWIIRLCSIQIFKPNSWFIKKNQGCKIDQNRSKLDLWGTPPIWDCGDLEGELATHMIFGLTASGLWAQKTLKARGNKRRRKMQKTRWRRALQHGKTFVWRISMNLCTQSMHLCLSCFLPADGAHIYVFV